MHNLQPAHAIVRMPSFAQAAPACRDSRASCAVPFNTSPVSRRVLILLLAMQDLPIDTSQESMRENLKRSQLGSRVMFLAKCPDENPTNKALAKELVQAWSRWGAVLFAGVN